MPIGPARMPLFDHLGELRMRLVRIVVCLLVGVCVFYFATPTMGQFLMHPIAEYLPKGPDGLPSFMAIDPFEAFSTRFKISIWAAIVACSPVILWQLLAFFLPALKPNERKWFIPTFAAAVALFIVGTVFCYCIILNPAFQWLTDQAMGLGTVTPRMASYVDIIIKFELGFGVAFELPLVIFYLVVFNVVPYKKLRNSWRGIYVGAAGVLRHRHARCIAGHHGAHVRRADRAVRGVAAAGPHRVGQAHQEAERGACEGRGRCRQELLQDQEAQSREAQVASLANIYG